MPTRQDDEFDAVRRHVVKAIFHAFQEPPERIGQELPKDNGGLGLSTVKTVDQGYETAINDANGWHPVERYISRQSAVKGHAEWIMRLSEIKEIVELGYGPIPAKKLSLVRIMKG